MMFRRLILILTLMSAAKVIAMEGAPTASSREFKKGFFALGVFGGMGGSRFLNSDGSYANYKTNLFGADLDVLLFDPGIGDIRMFIRHQEARSAGGTPDGQSLTQGETVLGLKVYAGSHLFLAGGMGPGTSKLSSPSTGNSLDLKYDVMRASLGLEFAISESVFLSIEGDYRTAPIRKNKNSDLTENSLFEGIGCAIRLIWSPPSVTMINYQK